MSRPRRLSLLPLLLALAAPACLEDPLPAGTSDASASSDDGNGPVATGGAAGSSAPSASGGSRGNAGSGGVTGSGGSRGGTGGSRGRRDGGADTTPPAPSPDASVPEPPAAPGACDLLKTGATGKEEDGLIPVCCKPSSTDKTLINEVFRLLNEHRAKNGRAALVYDDALEQAMQGHCRHMAEHTFFAHDAPEAEVSSPWDRAKFCGGSASGENIAYNQPNPADVIRTWIESPGHNENMLSAGFTKVGICHAQRRWGQLFGR